MDWVKSKTAIIVAGCLALVGVQGYSLRSVRATLEERMAWWARIACGTSLL
jgi:hypothetical protein